MLNSGQKSSKFAHKCNLLSQYLKENGSFGDISLEMTAKLQSQGVETSTRQQQQQQQATTTMNLLPILENPAEDYSKQNFVESTNDVTKSCFGSSASQMTIFYNGKVLVFNDFPAEKAKELMALAGRFGSSTTTTTTATTTTTSSASALEKAAFATPNLNIASSSTTPVGSQQVLLHHQHPQPIASDFPLTRRASLHRFFEKRKDRVTARAPYQVNNNSLSSMEAAAAKPEPTTPWLDLEFQSSKQLELKLFGL